MKARLAIKTVFLIMVLFTTAVSCGKLNRVFTSWTGDFTYKCSKAGTEYVQSDSGIAVLYDKEGKVVTCKE